MDTLDEIVDRAPFVGEIGLDYRFVTDAAHYEPQRQVFSTLLRMARDQDKIVNVHCAGAEQDTADLLVSSQIERVIIHWYSGPIDVLNRMIERGFMFTVGIELLHSDHIQEVARTIPDDQLLTETDNPGAMRWLVGEPGTPELVVDIVDELARVRGVSFEDVSSSVQTNLGRLFENDRHLAAWSARLSDQSS
jgi:TatD DNase family protein